MGTGNTSRAFGLLKDRLMEGKPVTEDAMYGVREIINAEARSRRPETDYRDENRADMQHAALAATMALGSYSGTDAAGKPVYGNPVSKGRELHILLGLPAAGKSTIADSLSEITGARIMDSDMVKEMIPEYDGGWGAAAVHEESGKIMDAAVHQSMLAGDSMILSKTSTDPEKLLKTMRKAQARGYSCYVHNIDLNPNKSMGRMLSRFESTGRYIPPAIAAEKLGPDGENLITKAFHQVIRSDAVSGYTEWSNDVPFGTPSVLLDKSADGNPVIEKLTAGASTDKSRLIGTAPESAEEAMAAMSELYGAIDEDRIRSAALSADIQAKFRQASLEKMLGPKEAMDPVKIAVAETRLANARSGVRNEYDGKAAEMQALLGRMDAEDGSRQADGTGPTLPGQ